MSLAPPSINMRSQNYGRERHALLCERLPCLPDNMDSSPWWRVSVWERTQECCWQVCSSSCNNWAFTKEKLLPVPKKRRLYTYIVGWSARKVGDPLQPVMATIRGYTWIPRLSPFKILSHVFVISVTLLMNFIFAVCLALYPGYQLKAGEEKRVLVSADNTETS